MNLAVTDGGGHLLAFVRMDGAILGSIDIALSKAKTSILSSGPSDGLWEFCKPRGPAADDGKYRNVWPPETEELIKQVQESAWTRPVQPVVSEPA
jgi:hypothetical protein